MLTFFAGSRLGSWFAYFVYNASCTAQQKKICAYFAKCREIRVFIKRPRREKSQESPGQINLSFVFFFSGLHCALFLLLFLMNFGFRFNSCSQFCKMTFPANFKGVLCHEICQGVRCCVSFVGGMTAWTRAWMRCENCEFLRRPKIRGLFLRELPPLKRINKGCRFDRFSWKSARVFVRYKRTKELSLKARTLT